MMTLRSAIVGFTGLSLSSCMQSDGLIRAAIPQPKEIIDLGTLVTEDLPERMWGKGFVTLSGSPAVPVLSLRCHPRAER